MDDVDVDWRPARSDGVVLVPEGEDVRIEGPGGVPSLRLNDTALALWELCDGTTTVAEMLGAIRVLCTGDADQIATDVRDTLAAFRRLTVVR